MGNGMIIHIETINSEKLVHYAINMTKPKLGYFWKVSHNTSPFLEMDLKSCSHPWKLLSFFQKYSSSDLIKERPTLCSEIDYSS